LVNADGAPGGNAGFFADATEDTSRAIEPTMPARRFVDTIVRLVRTTASLRTAARCLGADRGAQTVEPALDPR
jgi:hypothetical protein